MRILVYSPQMSKRLRYVLDVLLVRLLGTDWDWTDDPEAYRAASALRLNYSSAPLSSEEVHLRPSGLLTETGVREQRISTFWEDEIPAFFPVEPGADFGYDPLSCAFFMLSRYEEYLPFEPDVHGRFSASLSTAARGGFLHLPVVALWAAELEKGWQRYHPEWQARWPGYRFEPTYDVDMPWCFQYRGLRGLAGGLLDLLQGRWEVLRARCRVVMGKEEDPFFTFPYLRELHRQYEQPARFFWLLGNPSREDVNPSPRLQPFRELIGEIAREFPVGIHPSYQSFNRPEQLRSECERLASITGEFPIHSRQHFLRLRLPDTYRQLLSAGIRHDHSMGFADQAGYRAGMTEPFPWYDLAEETVTDLIIHPFAVMEVTLQQYEGMKPAQAAQRLLDLQADCKRRQLRFTTLWHNSSFSPYHDWEGWKEVYEGLF